MDAPVHTEDGPARTAAGSSRNIRRFAPLALGLFFALWGMQGLSEKNLPSDAPNHLLNGALIADAIRTGGILHPFEFAQSYYARLPAITIPFHPPGFPVVEAAFYLLFGVNVASARLALALMVAAAVVLFYRLIVSSGGSDLLAACATATFFSMPYVTYLASNVMLEIPTLVLVLAALYQLRDIDRGLPFGRALAFALFAGAAVWTKQQAVFLGLTPFAFALISRRWRLLAQRNLWISMVLLAVIAYSYTLLTAPFGGTGGVKEIPNQAYIAQTFMRRFGIYIDHLKTGLGVIPLAWILLSFAASFWPRRENNSVALDLHLAWAPAAFSILFLTGHIDRRYLFFVYPPLMMIGYSSLCWLCERKAAPRLAWLIPAALAAASVATMPFHPPNFYLIGPAESAAYVVTGKPRRVLYCGTVGTANFVFGVRTLDPSLQTTVLRADQFGRTLAPAEIVRIAHNYGVDTIVLALAPTPQPCDSLRGGVFPSMSLERTVPLVSSATNWSGSIGIYHFTDPSPTPENKRAIRIPKIGKTLDVEF